MMEGRKERKAARKAARQKEVEEFVRRKRLEQLQQNK
jgi:hypothetical protein